MGLFSRKKEVEEIPKLPDLPETILPELPHYEDTTSNQITNKLPHHSTDENKNEIKSAIYEQDSDMHESIASNPPLNNNLLPSKHFNKEPEPYELKTYTKRAEPIFIRLDKFEKTEEIFDNIKDKVEDIEKLLRRTKELKEKEDHQLKEWEKEIESIKLHLESIDRNIFNKLD